MSDDFDELNNIADFTTFATGRKNGRGSKKVIVSPMQKLQGFKNRRPRNAQKNITLVKIKGLEKPDV